MRVTEGDLLAWDLAADLVPVFDQVEAQVIGEIAWSVSGRAPEIKGVPGAFDVDAAGIVTTAFAIYASVAEFLREQLPHLFDAALDVTKDALKKRLDKAEHRAPSYSIDITTADPVRLHEIVRVAALGRRLADHSAVAIADAVVARLLLERLSR